MKMRFDIISAVPGILESALNNGILKIATEKGKAEYIIHNLHDYGIGKYRQIDDYPYGGGAGMLLMCEPLFELIEKLKSERDYDEIIYMSADAPVMNQNTSNELSLKENIIILAGHYKGVDQRVRDSLITREISIGDFVLTGGELPALVLLDSIVRLIPGVLGDAGSALDDSFQDGLLEPPQYTRPENFREMKVPEVLLSGNHSAISKWREEKSLEKTKARRPDLLKD
jgi:tRNA (guanine37-N1)-methyltransferase